jgi:hypothetical protein
VGYCSHINRNFESIGLARIGAISHNSSPWHTAPVFIAPDARGIPDGMPFLPGMNGTQLSSAAVAFAVGDFLELAARASEQLIAFWAAFHGPRLLASWS